MFSSSGYAGSPPLTRGIRKSNIFGICGRRFTPAHAGNTDSGNHGGYWWKVHPRSRGEYNQAFRFGRDRLGSPPLTRGIPLVSIIFTCLPGFTPAHAGNTHSPYLISCLIGVHPRSRGEYYFMEEVKSHYIGSPPLTRGILKGFKRRIKSCRFTPAHAGNT